MLVILKENIDNLGSIGDIVKVSGGYARNFLLPRNLVLLADESNKAVLERHKKALEKKKAELRAKAETLAVKLNEYSCTVTRKVGEGDRLFGSVTSHDIFTELKKAGIDLEKKLIHLVEPIKTLGVHSVMVKLQPEVVATLKVWVVKQ